MYMLNPQKDVKMHANIPESSEHTPDKEEISPNNSLNNARMLQQLPRINSAANHKIRV